MQDRERMTPMGEPSIVEFNSQLLFIAEPELGKINISFDYLSRHMKHYVKNYTLAKINYKTVLASLKGTHPQILSARLAKNPDYVWYLTVKVAYEFLPEIEYKIIFYKRYIRADESYEIAIRNMRNYLCNIKEQIASLTNVQTLTGQIDNNGDNFEVYSKIPHKQAVYTWALNLQRPNTSNLKTQMYYYNSLTKQKKNSKAIPDEGLYINNGNDSSFVEMRTFVYLEYYDTVIFSLEGRFEGDYTIAIERVELVA